MTLSIAAKQNTLYLIIVLLTAMGSILFFRATQQEWIIYREAEIKFKDKDYKTAISLYKKSLEAGLPISKSAKNLAESYTAIGNFKEAIVFYRAHLEEDPKDVNSRLKLAKTLSYIGNFEESEIEYKKILETTYENQNSH